MCTRKYFRLSALLVRDFCHCDYVQLQMIRKIIWALLFPCFSNEEYECPLLIKSEDRTLLHSRS